MKKTLFTVLLACGLSVQAGELFDEKELNISLFGVGEFGRGEGVSVYNDSFGTGFGVQKFFGGFKHKKLLGLQYGVQAEGWLTDLTNLRGSFIDQASLGPVLRANIGDSGVALFGGVGIAYDFEDADHIYEYFEGGVEFRTQNGWGWYGSFGFSGTLFDNDVDSFPHARVGLRIPLNFFNNGEE